MPKYQLADSRRRLRAYEGGDASLHFQRQKCGRVVIFAGVSSREQSHNLAGQIVWDLIWAHEHGAEVLGLFFVIGARKPPYADHVADELQRAARFARRHKAQLFAESCDRLIRHPAYDSRDKWKCTLRARDCDLDEMALALGGRKPICGLDPNATSTEVRRHRKYRSMIYRKLFGYAKARRDSKLPLIVKLHLQGKSTREIETATKVDHVTVSNWLCKTFHFVEHFPSVTARPQMPLLAGGNRRSEAAKTGARML